MNATPTPARHEDRGAALILAIGFMVLVGFVVGGLATLITSGVGDTVSLANLRDHQYSADAAVQQGIVEFRAVLASNTDWCASQHDYTGANQVNGQDVRVSCSQKVVAAADPLNPGVIYTKRDVTFLACLNTTTTCTDASSTLILRADVNFSGQPAGVTTFVQSWSVIK